MRVITIISILLFIRLTISCQEWCEKRKPAQLDKPPRSFDNKLVCDRFSHTVNPDITKYRHNQIEIATVLRPEFLENNEWVKNNSYSVYNIYSFYTIKHTFSRDLEFHLNYSDLIIKADQQIKDYSKSNVNTPISFGAKYYFYFPKIKPFKLAIYGQLTIPKFQNTFKTLFSPELRILLSHPYARRTLLTYNIGAAYSNKLEKFTIIYALNYKYHLGKKIELFTEFYSNYTKTGPPRTPNKRVLFGIGFFFLENLYYYSSFEAGWYHQDSLNDGRFDFGLAYRFP